MSNAPPHPERRTVTDAETVLSIFERPTARAVLGTLDGDTHTAKEISDRTDIPLSSVYRVLADLEDVGFVEEGIRIGHRGQHVTEYRRTIESITLHFADELDVRATLLDPQSDT